MLIAVYMKFAKNGKRKEHVIGWIALEIKELLCLMKFAFVSFLVILFT